MPSLTQMKYIVSVFENKSFSLASKECHVSQPSLSMQIQKAEDELEVTIFDRNSKPISVTDKGLKLVQQMKIILNESKRLSDLSKIQAGTLSGQIDLAVIPTVAPYLLPLILNPIAQDMPHVQVNIFEQTTSEILQNLKSKEIDAAILATPLNEPDLIESPLYYEPFYVLAHKAHPILKNKVVREQDIAKFPIWLLDEGHCFRTQTLSVCSPRHHQDVFANVKYAGGSIHTLMQIVLESDGCTLIPHLALKDLSPNTIKTHVRPLKKPTPSREISLVMHKSQWKTDVLSRIKALTLQTMDKELLKPHGLEVLEIENG
ncbi:MAG: hydrogen peroxide-inducible genes activator [Bdellovibrionaceae bacterium]|nr:hydrogen peroxide-inducible genes activator [Pseudobdellovibrionaceae bacterium]